MPYRCFKCDKLSRTEEVTSCHNQGECDVHYVELIHWATPKGPGKPLRSKVRFNFGQDKTQTIDEELRLGCYSEADNPTYTPLLPAVTCINCIELATSIQKE